MAAADRPAISYACYFTRTREGEQFVSEHVYSHQIGGTLLISDGENEYLFKEGDFRFIRRNNLLKFIKQPSGQEAFRSVSVYLDQQTLRQCSIEYGYSASAHHIGDPVIALPPNPLYKSFMDSLIPYMKDGMEINENLQALKLREAILILLQSRPSLKDVLFDFSEPGKIDLEAFMEKNFHFNVQIQRLAYLTGRSLATFKRDFEKIFKTTPGHWLLQRRLKEAHYLIKEKGKTASNVYLELGFEDLSHFSFAFKNKYGVSPSKV